MKSAFRIKKIGNKRVVFFFCNSHFNDYAESCRRKRKHNGSAKYISLININELGHGHVQRSARFVHSC